MRKAEVAYTEGVESILQSLTSPLSVVYTEVGEVFEKWIPALKKEVTTLDHAVDKVMYNDQVVKDDLATGRGQLIPMKVVYTIKPPDPPDEEEKATDFFKRKSRIVICGNLASHQAGEVYASTAPAEVVRAAIALSQFFGWNLGLIDIVAAFLQTPLAAVKRGHLLYMEFPPKVLVRAGLCRPGELWRLTHAVYGLQESPKLWGAYRDMRLAQVQLIVDGKANHAPTGDELNLHGGRCCKKAPCSLGSWSCMLTIFFCVGRPRSSGSLQQRLRLFGRRALCSL